VSIDNLPDLLARQGRENRLSERSVVEIHAMARIRVDFYRLFVRPPVEEHAPSVFFDEEVREFPVSAVSCFRCGFATS
jgi:hypothetical protein